MKIEVNSKALDINQEYFDKYCANGDSYARGYRFYTTMPTKLLADCAALNIIVDTILDVGCATGELVKDYLNLGIFAMGIDNSTYAIEHNICSKSFCFQADMRKLMMHFKENSFDIVYTNSLMYLPSEDVPLALKQMYTISKYGVYWNAGYLGESVTPDHYRKFTADRAWWKTKFENAGFEDSRSNRLWLK